MSRRLLEEYSWRSTVHGGPTGKPDMRSNYCETKSYKIQGSYTTRVSWTSIVRRDFATSSTFASRFHEKYFIVLDRLYDVLEDRVHKKWKQRYQRMGGKSAWGKKLLDFKGRKWGKLWEERLVASYDLSSALDYMHQKRVIHRDLKPDNIGFDIVSSCLENSFFSIQKCANLALIPFRVRLHSEMTSRFSISASPRNYQPRKKPIQMAPGI
jgi:hypothetical protein